MGRYATENGGSFTEVPAGTHAARCIRLIDIGTQHGEYEGKPNVRNQVIAQFELPNETIEIDGVDKPMIISKFYTNSLNEKSALRKDLESWRGVPFTLEELVGFDLETILGKACLLTVTHNEKGKAKITAVSKPMKGMQIPDPVNELDTFWIDDWDDNKFAGLPDGFRKLIMQSDEYKAAFTPPKQQAAVAKKPSQLAAAGIDEDDIPFN